MLGRVRRGQQHLIHCASGIAPTKEVRRNPVRAACKHWHAVEHEAEKACAGFFGIDRLIQLQRADANLPGVACQLVAILRQRDGQRVAVRLAQIVRPPQARRFDRQIGGGRVAGYGERLRGHPTQVHFNRQWLAAGKAIKLDAHGNTPAVCRRLIARV